MHYVNSVAIISLCTQTQGATEIKVNNSQNWNQRFTRRSSLSDGTYVAMNDRIPLKAWLAVVVILAINVIVMFVGYGAGF